MDCARFLVFFLISLDSRTLSAQIFDFHARFEKPMLLNTSNFQPYAHLERGSNAILFSYLFANNKKAKWEKNDARLNYWLMVMSVFVCIKLDLRYKMSTMRYEVIIFGLRVSANTRSRRCCGMSEQNATTTLLQAV